MRVKEHTSKNPSLIESARLAKIHHYLVIAEEIISSGRYAAGHEYLKKIFLIDIENKRAHALESEIQKRISTLQASAGANRTGSANRNCTGIILLVDQDPRVLASLMSALPKYGYIGMGASSQDEANVMMSLARPNLVISEVNFAEGPIGYDLFLSVKRNPQLKTIPFIYLASRISRELLIAGKRLGVIDFISKPLDVEVVMASVAIALPPHSRNGHVK